MLYCRFFWKILFWSLFLLLNNSLFGQSLIKLWGIFPFCYYSLLHATVSCSMVLSVCILFKNVRKNETHPTLFGFGWLWVNYKIEAVS